MVRCNEGRLAEFPELWLPNFWLFRRDEGWLALTFARLLLGRTPAKRSVFILLLKVPGVITHSLNLALELARPVLNVLWVAVVKLWSEPTGPRFVSSSSTKETIKDGIRHGSPTNG